MVAANHIPEDLIVDLAGHQLGDTIRWSDVKVPADVKATIADRDFVIASIKSSSAGKSAVGADAEEGGDGSEG
jgi:large subunit ribosomal protein L25